MAAIGASEPSSSKKEKKSNGGLQWLDPNDEDNPYVDPPHMGTDLISTAL